MQQVAAAPDEGSQEDDAMLLAACEAVEARLEASAAMALSGNAAVVPHHGPGSVEEASPQLPQRRLRPVVPPFSGEAFPRPPGWVLEALARADGLAAVMPQLRPEVAVQALRLPGSAWELLLKCLVLFPRSWADPNAALQEMLLHVRWTLACADMPRPGPPGLGREQEASPQHVRSNGSVAS